MRLSLIAAVLPALFVCHAALAQVSGMASPTPTMGATSPLGITSASSVSPTGIPFGSTEIASPGTSPMPTDATGTISMPGSGTTCSTVGTSPSGMFGSTATYDGGGMAVGTATPATATPGTRRCRQRRTRQRRRESRRHRECRQPQECWKPRDCRECAAPARAASPHRRLQRRRRPPRRVAPPEPEFRWDLPRSAISGSVPRQRYQRWAYCRRWVSWGRYQRCPPLHLRPRVICDDEHRAGAWPPARRSLPAASETAFNCEQERP